MKYLDKVVIAVALVLLCAAPSFAGHGNLRAARLNAAAAKLNAKAAALNAQNLHHNQQAIRVEQIYVPAQQLNSGYCDGTLQLNAGGCSQLYGSQSLRNQNGGVNRFGFRR